MLSNSPNLLREQELMPSGIQGYRGRNRMRGSGAAPRASVAAMHRYMAVISQGDLCPSNGMTCSGSRYIAAMMRR